MGRVGLVSVCVLLVLPFQARAYWGAYDVGNLAGLDFQYRMNAIQLKNATRAGSNGASTPPVTTITRTAGSAAQELAQNYPVAQRNQAAQLFESLLQKYAEIEKRFNIEPGDFGGALAAFVAGNMMAMRQQTFPDQHFGALVRQMRALVADNREFDRFDGRERRRAFEQMAIIGMFMAGTQMALDKQPDAALQSRTSEAARQYLARVMPGEVDRLAVTARGLQIR